MNISGHFSESFETVLWLKIHKLFDADPDPGSGIFMTRSPGSEIRDGKVLIRDKHAAKNDHRFSR
jgi:hypothetical protein